MEKRIVKLPIIIFESIKRILYFYKFVCIYDGHFSLDAYGFGLFLMTKNGVNDDVLDQ